MFEISEKEIEDFLDHHGVKGQKWGVRREGGGSGGSTQKMSRGEHKQWLKQMKSPETANKVFQEASKTMNPVLTKINKDPMFKDYNTNAHTRQQYNAVVQTIFNQHLAQASLKVTHSPDMRRAVAYQMTPDGVHMRATEMHVVLHAAGDLDGMPEFIIVRDENGMVIDIKMSFPSVAHDALDVDEDELDDFIMVQDYLDHHGIKGQRWGVRRRSPHNDSFVPRMNPKKLSDAELRAAVTRMNMEQQFSRLSSKPTKLKKGHDTVKGILAVGATVNAAVAFSQTPAGKSVMKAIANSNTGKAAVRVIGKTLERSAPALSRL